MADISAHKTALGGKVFTSKYTLTSIDIVGKKLYNTSDVTTFEYIIEGPISAVDSRNKKYKCSFTSNGLVYIDLPDSGDFDGNW